MLANWTKSLSRRVEPLRRPGVSIDESFRSLEEWLAWAERHPFVYETKAADDLARRVMRQGITEPLTKRPVMVKPTSGNNWREGLLANGLNARQRAVLALIDEATARTSVRSDVTIYATEGVTAFAKLLRKTFPRFLGSEFAINEDIRRAILPCLHQDLMDLNLPSNAFDIVTTNEVLEHVPELDKALREIARVLKPGGRHIGTVPFHFMSEVGDLRAKMVDGEVVHLKPPERHGNPADPEGGSLVFEAPGWDIIPRCRTAGFRDVCMRFVASERHGYLTENTGVFVLDARK